MSSSFLLSRKARAALSELDPARDQPTTSPVQVDELTAQIIGGPVTGAEPSSPLGPTDQLRPVADVRRPRSRRPLILVATSVAAVAVVGAGVIIAHTGSRPIPTVPAQADPAGAAESAAVRTASPLASGRSVDCGVVVPTTALASTGGAERGTSESSVALRGFLADNPWQEMSPVTEKNWLLLSGSERQLVFGQRFGPVGIGSVVTLAKTGGRWQPETLGGCGLVIPATGEGSGRIEFAKLSGRDLTLTWSNGICDGRLDKVFVRTETKPTSSGLHVLIVTRPNPGQPTGFCAGVGIGSTTHIRLDQPLKARSIRDDSKVPSQLVRLDR